DDYGSYLIAEDFRANPAQYPHVHPANVPYMESSALAVGRELDPNQLIPRLNTTCAVWVVDVRSLEAFTWIALREVSVALDFQETSHDGRVGDGGDGRNVHIAGQATNCS